MLGIGEEMLEKLGVYFVYHQLNDKLGLSFIQFVENWLFDNEYESYKLNGEYV